MFPFHVVLLPVPVLMEVNNIQLGVTWVFLVFFSRWWLFKDLSPFSCLTKILAWMKVELRLHFVLCSYCMFTKDWWWCILHPSNSIAGVPEVNGGKPLKWDTSQRCTISLVTSCRQQSGFVASDNLEALWLCCNSMTSSVCVIFNPLHEDSFLFFAVKETILPGKMSILRWHIIWCWEIDLHFDWLLLRRLVLETKHTRKYFFKCHYV